jgi:hypothetical protein
MFGARTAAEKTPYAGWSGGKRRSGAFLTAACLAALAPGLTAALEARAAGNERVRVLRAQDPVEVAPPATSFTPWVEAREGAGGTGEVIVNGEVVIRLRSSQGGLRPEQRAAIAAERLRAALAAGLRPADIQVDTKSDKANPRLKALGQVIATASAEEVRSASSTPGGLVGAWASALKRALALPGLTLSETRIIVPLGETRRVRIGGAARGDIFVGAASGADVTAPAPPAQVPASPDTRVVAASLSDTTSELILRGVTVGRETLTLNRDGAQISLQISVQPYAGRFDSPRAVTLTGTNVSADLIARMAAASALGAAAPLPGAVARLGTDAIAAPFPPPGESRTVTIPVSVTGPEMLPVSRNVSVTINNRSLPRVETDVLLYSNNPERLTGFGTLFVGRMSQAQGASRVLFHHQSDMNQPILFTVELINDKDQPVQVQAVGGSAGPVRDTVWVGYRAASDFVRDYQSDSGVIHTIPPRSRYGLVVTRLNPGLTISGLIQLRTVSGEPPLVRVAADPPGGATSLPIDLQPFPTNMEAAGSGTFNLSEHVYPMPTKRSVETFSVGGPWLFLPLGRQPITAAEMPARRLEGNYGVFYEYTINLENPTTRETKVFIVFEPSAGMAGGVFVIDGKTVEIPQTSPPAEPTLATYILPPGGKRTVTLRTVPLSGSNYPARITVRP